LKVSSVIAKNAPIKPKTVNIIPAEKNKPDKNLPKLKFFILKYILLKI
jgi:hypothetical protein